MSARRKLACADLLGLLGSILEPCDTRRRFFANDLGKRSAIPSVDVAYLRDPCQKKCKILTTGQPQRKIQKTKPRAWQTKVEPQNYLNDCTEQFGLVQRQR